MKTKRLKLTKLSVESFITKLDKKEKDTVIGGLTSIGKWCTKNPDCIREGRKTNGFGCNIQ